MSAPLASARVVDLDFDQPGVGTPANVNIPLGIWRVVAVRFTIATDATVAGRYPFFRIIRADLASQAIVQSVSINQPASLTRTFQMLAGYPVVDAGIGAVSGITLQPLPWLVVTERDRCQVGASNLQAGDQISAGMLRLLRWIG